MIAYTEIDTERPIVFIGSTEPEKSLKRTMSLKKRRWHRIMPVFQSVLEGGLNGDNI